MKDKIEIINDIEAFALDMTMRLEALESFDESKPDYWFFYHMLITFEQMITDVHQYEMLNKDTAETLEDTIDRKRQWIKQHMSSPYGSCVR